MGGTGRPLGKTFFLALSKEASRAPEDTYLPTSDKQETPAVSTPLAHADDRLSDIASVIPPVDPEMVTLKHSAFPA